MSWAEHHKASEAAAIEAEQRLRSANAADAARSYETAAELEQQAFAALDVSKTRTKGITIVSAMSLWYKRQPMTARSN